MSVKVMSWVFDQFKAEPAPKLIMLFLADRADPDGSKIFPSLPSIAEKVCLSERQVRRIMRDLESAGAIQRTGVHVPGGRKDRATFEYRIVMRERGDNLSARINGGTFESERGDISGENGGTCVTPKPSVREPSIDPPSSSSKKNPDLEPSAAFEAFYEAYPRHLGRASALKAFLRLGKEERINAMSDVLERNLKGWGCETRYIPHPATYLNQKRWEDEEEETPPPKQQPQRSSLPRYYNYIRDYDDPNDFA